MKLKKLILLAMTLIHVVVFVDRPTLAVNITLTYKDGLSTGKWTGPTSANTTQAATVKASLVECGKIGEKCWVSNIVKAFTFAYAAVITLPKVGETYDGGLFDQTFNTTTKTHEDWHHSYASELLGVTYGTLESWSNTYVSNSFKTEAGALAAGVTDLANGLTTASNSFLVNLDKQVTDPAFGHDTAYAHIVKVNGVDTWRSVNPDWGGKAVAYAKGIKVSFDKTAGDCDCKPVPGPLPLLGVGAAFGYSRKLRKHIKTSKSPDLMSAID